MSGSRQCRINGQFPDIWHRAKKADCRRTPGDTPGRAKPRGATSFGTIGAIPRGTCERGAMWAVAVGLLATAGLLGAWRRSGLPLFDLTALHAFRAYARLWHGVPRRGTRQLPAKGPALLIANHTCSADPAILQTCCPRPLCFLIAREYYHLPVARRFFGHFGMVPVARNGRDITALRVGLRRLAEGRVVCLFPEGGLSGAGTGRVRPGRGGAALLALRSGAPVYPAFIAGG